MNRSGIVPLAIGVLCLGLLFPPNSQQAFGQEVEQPEATLIICPSAFDEALRPWLELRKSQGFNLIVQRPQPTAYGITRQVRDTAKNHRLDHVVLIGDAFNATEPQNAIPADYVRATVNVQFGSEPEIATDQTYADLDGDGLPEFPVGRICADTPEQLSQVVQKIIDYETSEDFGTWRRRIDLIAGTGGFGQVIDKVIEMASKRMITDLIPHDYETSVTYGSWTSPYCPDPRRFSQTTIESLNRGGLFWIYAGHGHPLRLDRMQVPGGEFPIFEIGDEEKLDCQSGNPIGVMLSCYTGAFDFQRDCVAEKMVNQSGGPVAMICGTRVTMPYAMSLLTLEMMQDFFEQDEPTTLGQLFNRAQRRMVSGENEGDYRRVIEVLGKTFSPTKELLEDELKEHVYLFHIIGDPLLTLRKPGKVELSVAEELTNGQTTQVQGTSTIPGKLIIELAYQRDRMRFRPKRRKEFLVDHEAFMEYHETYQQANNRICDRQELVIPAGDFSIELNVPEEASGECVIRAYVAGSDGYSIGSAPVMVKKIRR